MNITIQKTKDGSPTLYLPEMDEHYHSTNGAIAESQHVFIKNGVEHVKARPINVVEIGFGTGLNTLLTILWAEKNKVQIEYWGYELHPLSEAILSELRYSDCIDDDNAEKMFELIHNAKWEETVPLTEYFSLRKIHDDVLNTEFAQQFDVVYFDAFAPNKQEEMWNDELFNKLASSMSSNAMFTTYCAKGSVKRMLKASGLTVKKVPGPPGKREMLTARKL